MLRFVFEFVIVWDFSIIYIYILTCAWGAYIFVIFFVYYCTCYTWCAFFFANALNSCFDYMCTWENWWWEVNDFVEIRYWSDYDLWFWKISIGICFLLFHYLSAKDFWGTIWIGSIYVGYHFLRSCIDIY